MSDIYQHTTVLINPGHKGIFLLTSDVEYGDSFEYEKRASLEFNISSACAMKGNIIVNPEGSTGKFLIYNHSLGNTVISEIPKPPVQNSKIIYIEGILYSIAGCGVWKKTDHRLFNQFHYFDEILNKWGSLPNLNIPRAEPAVLYYDSKIWVAGGYDEKHSRLTSVEYFDTLVGTWQSTGEFQLDSCSSIAKPISLFEINCFLYLVVNDYSNLYIKRFDKKTNSWINLSESHAGRYNCKIISLGHYIYFIGGGEDYEEYPITENSYSSYHSYNTRNGEWNYYDPWLKDEFRMFFLCESTVVVPMPKKFKWNSHISYKGWSDIDETLDSSSENEEEEEEA